MDQRTCPFCTLPEARVLEGNDLGVVIRDAYPVSLGHTLVIPRRHVGSFFDLTAAEQEALLSLLAIAKARLDDELKPDGHNIGVNDGLAAGQTVPHLHIHLIPRYSGDVPDPRGGIRWLFPDKADYWSRR
jgi:diadenosine tetraphosphate (Ap4A) HIT family hydrolase